MFDTLSKAGLGVVIITILNLIFPLVGIDVPEGSTGAFVENIGNALGFVLLVWGQVARKDLIGGVVRR
jgi:hypothetical protein